ncbi:MAG: hypothetical protein R3C53_17130 [Pirellulaceae bacterium]
MKIKSVGLAWLLASLVTVVIPRAEAQDDSRPDSRAAKTATSTSQDQQQLQDVYESLEAEVIDVTQVQLRLKNEVGLSDEEARRFLESRTRAVLGNGSQGPQSAAEQLSSQPSLLGVETSSGNIQLSLDQEHRGVKVHGHEMIIAAPADEIRRAQELLTTMEQFGLRQVVIKTYVLRDTTAAMKRLPIRWSHVEAVSRVAEQPQSGVIAAAGAQATGSQTTAALYAGRRAPATEDLPPPDGVTTATWTQATSIVERSTPVLYTILTPEEMEHVLYAVTQSATIKRVMTPTLVVFNGQVATISDSVERPFVTGIRPVLLGEGEQKQVEFAPSIRIYPEGTTMKLQPQLTDGNLRITCQLDLCKIRSVETLELPGIDEEAAFTVQMPEVASTQFRTCMMLPANHTLAVSAFETDEHGGQQTVLVLCQCSLRDVEPK